MIANIVHGVRPLIVFFQVYLFSRRSEAHIRDLRVRGHIVDGAPGTIDVDLEIKSKDALRMKVDIEVYHDDGEYQGL